jgi:hypothetical protein
MPLTMVTTIHNQWPLTRLQSFSPGRIAAMTSPIQLTVYHLRRPVAASSMK